MLWARRPQGEINEITLREDTKRRGHAFVPPPVVRLRAVCEDNAQIAARVLAELLLQHVFQRRPADDLELVAHALDGVVDRRHAGQINRRG